MTCGESLSCWLRSATEPRWVAMARPDPLLPPCNPEAEGAVMWLTIHWPQSIPEMLAAGLLPRLFYASNSQSLIAAALEVFAEGDGVDWIVVRQRAVAHDLSAEAADALRDDLLRTDVP